MSELVDDALTPEELFQAALLLTGSRRKKASQALSRCTDKTYILIATDGSILSRIPLVDVHERCVILRKKLQAKTAAVSSIRELSEAVKIPASSQIGKLASGLSSSPGKIGYFLVAFAVVVFILIQYSHRNVVLSGTLILLDSDGVTGSWNDCRGTGGYEDIKAGKQVTIRNKSGEIVASTSYKNLDPVGLELLLQSENWSSEPKSVSELQKEIQDKSSVSCVLYFSAEIPSNLDFIQVDSRGSLIFTRKELEDQKYILGFTLGV